MYIHVNALLAVLLEFAVETLFHVHVNACKGKVHVFAWCHK